MPGMALIGDGFLGLVYLLALGYIFMGVALVSDIFME